MSGQASIKGIDDHTLSLGTSIFTPKRAREIVAAFAEATTSRDPDRVASGFSESCVARFNCVELRGREEIRRFFAERLPKYPSNYKCEKTLRTISGNVLGVTFHSTWIDAATNTPKEGRGSEFWVFDGELVVQFDATFGM